VKQDLNPHILRKLEIYNENVAATTSVQ
jgi:hypothetical protein